MEGVRPSVLGLPDPGVTYLGFPLLGNTGLEVLPGFGIPRLGTHVLGITVSVKDTDWVSRIHAYGNLYVLN